MLTVERNRTERTPATAATRYAIMRDGQYLAIGYADNRPIIYWTADPIWTWDTYTLAIMIALRFNLDCSWSVRPL